MSSMTEKSFKFYVPLELVKSDKDGAEDDWKIKGIASTPDEDLQGETVDQEGLDIGLLKAGRGLFNFDHQKGPENVLGQIEDADFIDKDGKRCLQVEGYLFKHQDRAKAMYNIMRSLKKGAAPRVQMSIEGKILQRDFVNNKAIKKARIDKVALTLDPVNPYTYADLCKSLASPEPIAQESNGSVESDEVVIKKTDLAALVEFAQKALAAGVAGTKTPSQMSSGEATTKESLESDLHPTTYSDKDVKRKKDKKAVVRSMMKSLTDMYPDHDPLDIAEMVIESLVDKVE